MDITRVSASDLKFKTSEILNTVAFGGESIIVERYGEDFVKIVPITKSKTKNDYQKLLDKYYGSVPDFPKVDNLRVNSKKDLTF